MRTVSKFKAVALAAAIHCAELAGRAISGEPKPPPLFRVRAADGRYLWAFFGVEPEWCYAVSGARRYGAAEAGERLQKLHALGIQAGMVPC